MTHWLSAFPRRERICETLKFFRVPPCFTSELCRNASIFSRGNFSNQVDRFPSPKKGVHKLVCQRSCGETDKITTSSDCGGTPKVCATPRFSGTYPVPRRNCVPIKVLVNFRVCLSTGIHIFASKIFAVLEEHSTVGVSCICTRPSRGLR